MKKILVLVFLWAGMAVAADGAQPDPRDLLVKLANPTAVTRFSMMAQSGGAKIEPLGVGNWVRVQLAHKQLQSLNIQKLSADPNVLHVQPNYKLTLLNNYKVTDAALRTKIQALKDQAAQARAFGNPLPFPMPGEPMEDNPDIPTTGTGGRGADPNFGDQWGMNDIGVKKGWSRSRGAPIIVGVIDTGVDYTHEDLADNLWYNGGESGAKANNGKDDDGNGYVDDLVGWDFVSDDNKPFDLSVGLFDLLLGGGNPGHGTHCAGNVAARADNGKGVVGVAPEAKIMVLRFLSEKGMGDTAGAVKAIQYGIANGAKILSNSWGSEGEDPADAQGNQALKDAIQAAEDAGVIFVAAAGNGHQGVGYDNDSDKAPAYPASYSHDIIISVAALDSSDALGSFSNWGQRTVDIGAPGVKVFSTTVGSQYSDTVINLDFLGLNITWDGTSMAAPHVAGAAALYWSQNPDASWQDVKQTILSSAQSVSALNGKSTSGGKLNVEALMQ